MNKKWARVPLVPIVLVVSMAGLAAVPAGASLPIVTGKFSWAPEAMGIDHQITLSEALADASSFDVIMANRRTYAPHVGAMKEANPRLVLFVYHNGAFANRLQGTAYPESWYARNTAGQKIKSLNYGNYLMDISHPDWVRSRGDDCASLLALTGYDGCAIDMLGTAPLGAGYLTSLPVNPRTGRVWTEPDWVVATANIATVVKRAVTPAKVMANGLRSGPYYFAPAGPSKLLLATIDGGMAEGFIRAAYQPVDEFRSEEDWKQDVDMLVDVESSGKSVFALAKVWTTATDAAKAKLHKFAFASFLLGTSGRSRFYFSGDPLDMAVAHPAWQASLGSPSGPYTNIGGVYQRTFSTGKVLVNPSEEGRWVSLGRQYRDEAGTLRTALWLGPNSGEVLTLPT